ncbi:MULTISPECIES: hypothetical protein [unclassified Leptolyngbya]|uniref:hypothetical protein n=1 Tax=unclassified Leptolyngbya TaxID=2650499 RepID=UPI001684F577|nr:MULTISPECIES: hypothetical protein [unclassified Leptolyngbya]MBD1910237.1 hypothetical protein [Leptolyngbya sp. FACHB-8]MBD2156440.1 hypothetical protein [Leptolyngbya sp. FACHB-16]
MDTSAIDTLTAKLIHIIKTRDPDKVRFWADQLDRQKNQFLVAQIIARVDRSLQKTDRELRGWFRDIYCANYSPELKKLWLDFVDLCGLSL